MRVNAVLLELFDRLPELVRDAVADRDVDTLCRAPREGANTIAWLVWHLTRVQDHHVAELLDQPQLWVTENWGKRFGVASDPSNTGYGHKPADVASIVPESADVLVEYYDAVSARTRTYLRTLTEDDLGRVVDNRWDPPVTLGVRLISVAVDDIEHAGQAAYLRGLTKSSRA